LNEKVAAAVKKTEFTAVGIRCADHTTPLYPQKLAPQETKKIKMSQLFAGSLSTLIGNLMV
jgi:hypothetical protein